MNILKRSEINKLMKESISFLEEQKFHLPKFAFWSVEEWKKKGEEIREIIDNQLGWDITDFGRGNFAKFGLILFTIRNGNLAEPEGKDYCEKIMIADENQMTPMHHHYQKTEDIINRGGGILVIELYNATDNDELANAHVEISIDGVLHVFEAGTKLELLPGESVTLKPHHYHRFWAKEGHGKLLIGEVSKINDDHVDNKFLKDVGRFPKIEEDEPPIHLLYDDYQRYIRL